MDVKDSLDKEDLIRYLSNIDNIKDDMDIAICFFSILCISNVYKIRNPYDIINADIKKESGMREPRAFLYYILWVSTGRTYKGLSELCPASSEAFVCRSIQNVKGIIKKANSNKAVDIKNIRERVERFKESIKNEIGNE